MECSNIQLTIERRYIRLEDSLYTFKEQLLQTGLFKHKTGIEYTCDCPFCGDRKDHCYVAIDMSSDKPVMFNCFKCASGGRVGKKFLEGLGLNESIRLPKYSGGKKLDVNTSITFKMIGNTVNEHDDITRVCQYIESRVGHYPSLEELQMFQYVGNPRKYALDYLGYNGEGRPFNNRYWFKLTNGNITGRWKNNDEGTILWLRFNSTRIKDAGMYTIKKGFDPYKPLNICIAEGIMDVIGLYYNYPIENAIYIATMGKYYSRGIKHALSRGLFGDSVNIKIFKDSDVPTSNIKVDAVMGKLFKHIDIYENLMGKDYGVLPDELDIHKIIMR